MRGDSSYCFAAGGSSVIKVVSEDQTSREQISELFPSYPKKKGVFRDVFALVNA